jgi:uncharacterized membrane protein
LSREVFSFSGMKGPAASWNLGIIVALALIASLLLFSALVQRINRLQITNVLAFVGDKGRETIKDMAPVSGGATKHIATSGEWLADDALARTLTYSGAPKAVCRIDVGLLMRLAQEARGMIVVTCAVGDTLVLDTPVLRIHGSFGGIDDRQLLTAFELRPERTFEQDLKFALRLLVDIAIKALSPAINDPTTAVQTIDQLEDLLKRIQRHKLASGEVRDTAGILRVVIPVPTWEDYVNLAFEEIRQYGADSVQVMRRMRSALNALLSAAQDEEMQTILRRFLADLDVSIDRSFDNPGERLLAKHEDRQGLGGSHRSL